MTDSPNGYYRMARGWMEHQAFGRETFTRAQAWCWLIEKAAWQARRQPFGKRYVAVKRGQYAVSQRYLAETWQWSKSKVERYIRRLQIEVMIEVASGPGYTVVTICNYEKYQAEPNATGPGPDRGVNDFSEKEPKIGPPIGPVGDPTTDCNHDIFQADNDEAGPPIGPRPDHDRTTTGPREKELRREEGKEEDSHSQKMIEVWNTELAIPPKSRVRVTDGRKVKLRKRLTEDFNGSIEQWSFYVKRIAGSSFLRGENGSGWKATLDWAINPQNMAKVLEGNYDGRTGPPQGDPHGDSHMDQAIREAGP